MPMFVSVPTSNLAESADFWIRGLGFFDLFSVPDRLTHLAALGISGRSARAWRACRFTTVRQRELLRVC